LQRKKVSWEKNDEEAALCDSVNEFYAESTRMVYLASKLESPKREEARKNIVEVEFPKALDKLARILEKNGTNHLIGSQLTYVDLLWWYNLENASDQGLIDLSKYPLLAKFKEAIEARPRIAAYRSNPARRPVQYAFPRYVMHSYKPNNNANKALIAAEFADIKIDFPAFKFGTDNKTPEFFQKNPNGEVPTLDSPDGPIYESNAICRYIARKGNDKGLYGSSEYESSLVDQWIEWYRSKIEKDYFTWLFPIFSWATFDKEKYEAAKAGLAKSFAVLNKHLESNQWIVGKRVTIADIVFLCSMTSGFNNFFTQEYLQPFPHFVSWVKRMIALPQVSKHITIQFCDREKQPGEGKFG